MTFIKITFRINDIQKDYILYNDSKMTSSQMIISRLTLSRLIFQIDIMLNDI